MGILSRFFKSRINGPVGEGVVSFRLNLLDPNYYFVFNNLVLPSNGRTKTAQIDHVVVSNFGVFCIETKNYSGWIFGNADHKYWTQVIYHNKERFYNPLRQNYAHTKAVESLLKEKYKDINIHGYVAFPSAGKLQIAGTNNVGFVADVIKMIKNHNNQIFSND